MCKHEDWYIPHSEAYFWIVWEGVCESVGGLREESTGTVCDQRGCSSDERVVGKVFYLKHKGDQSY